MLVLMTRAITRRPCLHQALCHFCCKGSSQVLPEYGESGQLQGTRSSLETKSTRDLAIRLHETHIKLRDALHKGENFEKLWSKHSSDTSDLSSYATSMHRMALKWERQSSSLKRRNSWILARVMHYYIQRKNLLALQEEMQRAKLDPTLLTPTQEKLLRDLEQTLPAFLEQQLHKDVHETSAGFRGRGGLDEVGCEGIGAAGATPAEVLPGDAPLPEAIVYSADSGDVEQLHSTNRVRVLDVGSCYNPLGRYPHLHVTPIDLMPATQDVYKCDFLTVEVVDASQACDLQHEGDEDPRGGRQIERLPRNYYDVVVFSLVLDYIPCPEARLRCCSKAYQLLRPGGLLLIITPLGSSVLVPLIFKWTQWHLARLGFSRLKGNKNEKHRTFAYRKGFIPLLCSETEVERLEIEIEYLQGQLKTVPYRAEYDNIDLSKGIYFSRDFKNIQ